MSTSAARRLFVTGGSGFLGRHIVRDVIGGAASPRWAVVAPSSRELDLRLADAVDEAVRACRPTAIVHTAYRQEDRRSIVDATRHVAEAAQRAGCRLVHVSTDVVFGGRPEPYREADPPSPVHDYGRAKADAERIVGTTCTNAVTVRTSLILGTNEPSSHEVVVHEAITGRRDMVFFGDEIRSPVLVDDLAHALVELAGRTEIEGILHLGGPDAVSRADLARMCARRHGWDATKLRLSTIAESGLVRPGRIVLDSGLARSLGISVDGPGAWSSSDPS